MAPLLPKLRGHFAEFLNKGSSARLRILSSPTCVGLRYGRLTRIVAFLGSLESAPSLLIFDPHHTSDSGKRICLLSILCACTPHQLGAARILLRPHFFIAIAGTGISTCCPSTTPFGLTLGPDLP